MEHPHGAVRLVLPSLGQIAHYLGGAVGVKRGLYQRAVNALKQVALGLIAPVDRVEVVNHHIAPDGYVISGRAAAAGYIAGGGAVGSIRSLTVVPAASGEQREQHAQRKGEGK